MMNANKIKLFFAVIFAVLLIVHGIMFQMNQLQFESSQMSNFLISKNAIKCIVGNHSPLTKEELEDVMQQYPSVAIMTFQNRASFRCLGFYSKNLNCFDKYLIRGRFFYPDEVNEESNKIVAGKNIINSSIGSINITQKGTKIYAEIDEVDYEVIGIIGDELSSSLDNLVIFSSQKLNHFIYYLDGENEHTNKKAFNYVREKYNAEEIEKQSSLMDSVIKTDTQFEILHWIQFSIEILLIIVLAYLSYKMNRSMLQAQYLMGLPLRFAVKESSKNIFTAGFAALVMGLIAMTLQQSTLKEAFNIVYNFASITAFLLLIQSIVCVATYRGWTFNRVLPDYQGDRDDRA